MKPKLKTEKETNMFMKTVIAGAIIFGVSACSSLSSLNPFDSFEPENVDQSDRVTVATPVAPAVAPAQGVIDGRTKIVTCDPPLCSGVVVQSSVQ